MLLYKAEKWRRRNLLFLGILSTSHTRINTLSIYGETARLILATLFVSNLGAQNYGTQDEISRTEKPFTVSTFPRNINRPLNIIQYEQQPRHTTGLKYSRATPRHISSWTTQTTYQRILPVYYSPMKQFHWTFKPQIFQLHRCYRRSMTLQCRPKHRNLSIAAERSLKSCGTTVTLFRYVVTADTTPSTTVQRSLANQMH